MIEGIDLSAKFIKPRLYLCKPNRQTIAELKSAYNINTTDNYGGLDELSFQISYVIEKYQEYVRNDQAYLIRGHYLIRYEADQTDPDSNQPIKIIKYYIISKPKNIASDGKEIKQVHCYLLPYQFKNKIIRSYSGTKKLYDILGVDGVLNDTLLAKTDWTVGYVDSDIANKYRTFDVSQKSLLDFLFELQDTYSAIIEFDTVNKTISFKKNENIGRDRGFSIEYGKYLKSIDEDPDFDNVFTRLYAYGKDNLNIRRVNPTGMDYIDSLDYYMYPFERDINRNVIKHSNYMSDELCHAILDHQELVESKSGQFTGLFSQKEDLQTTLTAKENEMQTLQDDMDIILDNMDLQQSSGTITNYDLTYIGTPITKTTSLTSTNKYAVLCKVSSVDNLTITLDGIVKTLNVDTWTMLNKITNVTTSVFDISGINSNANVKISYVKITDEEYDASVYATDKIVTPSTKPTLSASGTTSTLPIDTYFVSYTWVGVDGETLSSPEESIEITYGQQIDVVLPTFPSNVTSANIYISGISTISTKQGNTTTTTYVQSIPLVVGTNKPIKSVLNQYSVGYKQSQIDAMQVEIDNINSQISALQFDITISTGSNASGNLKFKIDSNEILVAVVNGDSDISIANKIQSTINNQANYIATVSTNVVTVKYCTANTSVDVIFTDNSTGVVATIGSKTKIGVDSQISALRYEISTDNPDNFTGEQILELNEYIHETVWSDSNYSNDVDLYEDAKEELFKISQPLISYEIDIVDFLKAVICQKDWNKLNLGDTITIKYPNFGINIKAKIISIDHNIDDNSINLKIANNKDIKSGFLTLKDMLKNSVNTTTSVDISKFKWDQSQDNTSKINDLINNTWSAISRKIVAGVNESVEISGRGIVITSPDDPNKKVIFQSGIIALSSDGGITWRTALTGDYIVAEQIAGKLGQFVQVRADQIVLGDNGEVISDDVLGGGVVKQDTNYNSNYITQDGILVKNGTTERVKMGEYETSKYGLQVKDSNGNSRVELGEYDTDKFGLKVLAEDGQTTILNEVGVLSPIWAQSEMVLLGSSSKYKGKFSFYIPSPKADISELQLYFYSDKTVTWETQTNSSNVSLQQWFDGSYTLNDYGHSHSVPFIEYYTPSSSVQLSVKIDGVDRTTELGGTWDMYSTYTLDIKQYVTDMVGWHTIEFIGTDGCTVWGHIQGKVLMRATQ